MTDPIVLQYLRSIEEKIDSGFQSVGTRLDFHDEQLSSLNETRAEQRGGFKVIVGLSTIVSGIVGYIAALMEKS